MLSTCRGGGGGGAAAALRRQLRGPLRRAASGLAAGHKDVGTFDYVIVGGGSAGCVLANRLSKDPKVSVAVIEAGGRDNYHFLHVPVGYLYMIRPAQRRSNWGFCTSPQPGLHNRAISYPRGKTLGGCAAINGMIVQRGQPSDYDYWGDVLGDESWGWEAMRPKFDALMNYQAGDPLGPDGLRRGTEGPMHVSSQRLSWRLLDDFADACERAGIPRRTHFHDSVTEGVGYFEVTQKGGIRHSAYRAFLHPVRHRPNLTVISSAHASRVLLDRGAEGGGGGAGAAVAARGVEFWRRARRDTLLEAGRAMLVDHTSLIGEHGDHGAAASDELCRIQARREVLLTSGAIGSPHLLQCSGIGPDEVLREHGVETIVDLPGVGENLHDHLQIRMSFKLAKHVDTLNTRANSLLGRAKMAAEYALSRSGPLSMAPSQLGLFAKSRPEVPSPDLQWHVQPLSLDSWDKPLHPWPGLTAAVCALQPTSRGSVRLTSPDTRDPPTIDPAYLSSEHDKRLAVRSLRKTREIAAQLHASLEAEEYVPGSKAETDEELLDAAGHLGTSIFHPTGTTRMGPDGDPGAVLDRQLRVRDGRGGLVRGLRVVDCGSMPRVTSGNTNVPTMALAEKAAEMICAGE